MKSINGIYFFVGDYNDDENIDEYAIQLYKRIVLNTQRGEIQLVAEWCKYMKWLFLDVIRMLCSHKKEAKKHHYKYSSMTFP